MYERLIESMRGFQAIREKDGVATINGDLPYKQQRRMDSIIKQACRIGNEVHFKIARNQCNTIAELSDEITDLEKSVKKRDKKIKKLEDRLTIDTLNPNRRAHIIELQGQIRTLLRHNESLVEDVAHEKYQHYETCEGEGLRWDGDIPEKPEGY